MKNGAVSQTILQNGGRSIQDALLKNHKTIRIGEIAVTEGGELKCKYILHSALYSWTPLGNFSLKVRLNETVYISQWINASAPVEEKE